MKLSVILSTYEAPEWLEKVLWGYLNQSYRDFELVVADDGSTEETERVIRRYSGCGIKIRHVWEPDRGFRKSRILNRAIAAAGADYLVFSDGDCIPRADFLAVHAALAAKGRFLSGGYVKLPLKVSRAVTRTDVETGHAFSVPWLRSRGVRNLRRTAKLAVPAYAAAAADRLTTTKPTWNGHNASGWRRDLVAANGFDERMGYGGQDREMGERLENAGIRGRCVRYRALCVHLDHERGYAALDSTRRNKAIRRRTRRERITRTEFGIMRPLHSFRDEFPVSKTHIFLNHAGVSPTSTRAVYAVNRFMNSLAKVGRPDFDDWEALATECRERFARLIGCGAGEVAFVRNTSHGLSLLAAGLDWRPGDRVAAATSVEYPSNVYPWMDLDRRGIAALDVIPAEDGGTVTVEAAARTLTDRTRVLAVSSAQYATGAVTDLAGLGALCRERGVIFCVDGIQTVGVLPIDVKAAGVHFLSADSHKWMLGIMGIGAVFVDRSVVENIHPPLLGWRSTTDNFNFDRVHFELLGDAGRYEEGSLAYPLIAGFCAALELLEDAGIGAVAEHVSALVDDLAGRLEELGCETMPRVGSRRHILAFRHPGLGGEELLDGLTEAGVVVSLRRGRIRASPHLYNTHEEMKRVAETVRALLRSLPKGTGRDVSPVECREGLPPRAAV